MSRPGGDSRPVAVVDIDGVVADVRHRLHHVERRPKNWTAFFAGAADDSLLVEGARVVKQLSSSCDIVWLTGRPESLRAVTDQWLRRHTLPDGELLMRASRDFRPSAVTKVHKVSELAKTRSVHVLVDDDTRVLSAVRAAGFEVLVADWMPRSPALAQAQHQDGRT